MFYLRVVYYQNLERAKHVFGQSKTFCFGDVNSTNQKKTLMLKLWKIRYLMFNSQTAERLIYQEFLHKITNLEEASFMTKKKIPIISNVGQLSQQANYWIVYVCVCGCVKMATISPCRTECCRKAITILKKKELKFFCLYLSKLL